MTSHKKKEKIFNDQKNPPVLYHISYSQLSIARHYGGCEFSGERYIYNPEEDTLIRYDVLEKDETLKESLRRQAAEAHVHTINT